MDKSIVYHTATSGTRDAILSEGLRKNAHTQTTLSKDDIVLVDGWYCYPNDATQDKIDYAYSLILTILESNRPRGFPKHHNCLFFFPTDNLVGELNRPVIFEIDTQAFNGKPLYQADFKVAEQLFFDLLRDFEIGDQIKESKLQRLAQEYWNSASKLSTIDDADSTAEIFSPVETIPTKHITEIS